VQRERIRAVRAHRSAIEVGDCLADVAAAASNRRNTIPAILKAVHAKASLGEICEALASIWGYADSRSAYANGVKASGPKKSVDQSTSTS
jgi:methylmalonyl-CoA mutase N-terminal domain/subunit